LEDRRGAYKVLVERPEGQRPLLRHRRGRIILRDLQEARWGVIDWFDVAEDRDICRALVNAVMALRVP